MLRLSQSLRNRKFAKVGFKDGFQVTWNFLESFQLSDFNEVDEMQNRVTWDLKYLACI